MSQLNRTLFALALTTMGLGAGPSLAAAPYAHVLLLSVDGLHAIDLANYAAAHPASTLASLAKTGIQYANALTPAPSDSFPGMLALVTGGTPRSTGVFYDDSFDRTYFEPGSDCTAAAGAEVRSPRTSTSTRASSMAAAPPASGSPRSTPRSCP